MIEYLWALLVDGYADALDTVTRAGGEAVANLAAAQAAGTLLLEIDIYPDGATYGEFVNTHRERCWDGCNDITTFHRGTYCRFVAAHADLDCGCNEGYYQQLADAMEDEQDALAAIDEVAQIDIDMAEAWAGAVQDEEPF